MPNPRHALDKDALRSVADTLLAWLGGILAFAASLAPDALGAILGPRFMRQVERELRKLIFARAALKLEARSPANAPCHPRPAPTGFKRSVGRCSALRLVTRNLLPELSGYSSVQRLARVARVVGNLAAYVRRALKRIHRGFVRARILSVQPPPRMLFSCAPTPRAACADTS